MAAIGPAVLDLAALVAGKWSAEQRTQLTLDYYKELERAGGAIPSFDEFLVTLDYGRLELAVQWLGWAPNWTPPPDHAQDWLHVALSLGGKLGLL
jgi:hypothetical protein